MRAATAIGFDLAIIGGAGAIVYGTALYSEPVAWMVGGAFAIALGIVGANIASHRPGPG